MPPRQPRHAAPRRPASSRTAGHRSAVLPGTLLAAAGIAFAGLAVMPAAAAEVTTPQLLAASTLAPVELAPTELPPVELPAPPNQANVALSASLAQGLAVANSPSPSPSPVVKPPPPPKKPPAKASRDRKVTEKYVRPGQGRRTSGFGRRWGRLHAGVDLASGIGSPIRAVAAGRIESAGSEGGYGRVVRVNHGDGTVTVYAHMSAILVSDGEKVGPGEQIGREGNTGQSTGPHLHFEVRINGAPINPIPWLAARGIKV